MPREESDAEADILMASSDIAYDSDKSQTENIIDMSIINLNSNNKSNAGKSNQENYEEADTDKSNHENDEKRNNGSHFAFLPYDSRGYLQIDKVAIIYIYAFTLARYRVCLCNYTRPFGDVLCFRYRITDEEIARFCEMSDEEFSEPFEDDGGEDYVPPVNDEESDIEDVRLGEILKMIPIEKEVEVDSDEEEDLLTEVENTTMPPLADVYHSPDSTVWNKTPLPSSQTRSYNIIRESGGPNRITTLYTRTDTFNALCLGDTGNEKNYHKGIEPQGKPSVL
ncbi:hypothetical protein QE152_g40180 [Popillia japonica]|uniref:Uncharacterized protein n=1 Tax=Popillia japonica TaxID=7064 RepID=A0AAW1HS69_POPJA